MSPDEALAFAGIIILGMGVVITLLIRSDRP